MALGKFSLREVLARPTRVLLTFMSIAIGVGAVVAVLLATSTSRLAQRQMLSAVSGKADLEIVTDASTGFSYELVAKTRETPGVKTAVPSVNRIGVLFSGERRARTQVLGIDPRVDQQVRDYELVEGRLPTALNEILLDRSFAHSLEIAVDADVKILARGGLEQLRVVGLVRPSGTALSLGSAAYLVLPTAQRIFKAGVNIDQLQLIVNEDSDVEQVMQRLATEMPDGVTVRKPRTSSDMARETLFATENGLHMAIAFALLLAAFIIYNTFQMSVGERRRQLGILRAIGATRKQVSWMIMREALWISAFAAFAGCFLGFWGAQYLNLATEQILQVRMPAAILTVWPFLIAVTLGMTVSALGAWLPARSASRVEPVEAMRAIEVQHNDEVVRRATPLGFLFIAVGLIFLGFAVSNWLPLGADVVSIVSVLLGCILLIPLLLNSVSGMMASMLSHWLGIESKLAHKQLTRHLGRTSLTIGVLFIAMSTSAGTAGNILDNVENITGWYSRAIIGDFFVRASLPDLATGSSADLPEGVGEHLSEIDGIQSLDPMRFANVQSGEHTLLLIVRNFIGNDGDFFDLVEGDNAGAIGGLGEGKVVVGSVLAQRLSLGIGDTLPLETGEGTVQLDIVATANDYLGGGLTVYMERKFAEKLLGVSGVDAYIIRAEKAKLATVEAELQKYCQDNGLMLQSYAELVTYIDNMINGVLASLWMLLALGSVIAAMGLVNTLTMNILEQTREIGMLRVVAMTRNQVRRMIFAQATLLGLLGLIPGAVAGIFVAYTISLSASAVLGHDVVFHFRPWLVIGCLLIGITIVMGSSLIPAERAARLKLASALHYE